MGHLDAMSPERYGAVRGGAAPFPAAPPSKWRPFNNYRFSADFLQIRVQVRLYAQSIYGVGIRLRILFYAKYP